MNLSVNQFKTAIQQIGNQDAALRFKEGGEGLATTKWERFQVGFFDLFRSSAKIEGMKAQVSQSFIQAMKNEHELADLSSIQAGTPLTARAITDAMTMTKDKEKTKMSNELAIHNLAHMAHPAGANVVSLTSLVNPAVDKLLQKCDLDQQVKDGLAKSLKFNAQGNKPFHVQSGPAKGLGQKLEQLIRWDMEKAGQVVPETGLPQSKMIDHNSGRLDTAKIQSDPMIKKSVNDYVQARINEAVIDHTLPGSAPKELKKSLAEFMNNQRPPFEMTQKFSDQALEFSKGMKDVLSNVDFSSPQTAYETLGSISKQMAQVLSSSGYEGAMYPTNFITVAFHHLAASSSDEFMGSLHEKITAGSGHDFGSFVSARRNLDDVEDSDESKAAFLDNTMVTMIFDSLQHRLPGNPSVAPS